MRKFSNAPLIICGLVIAFIFFIAGFYFGKYFKQDSISISYENDPPQITVLQAGDKSSTEASVKININEATVDELCELEGIGPVLADRIISYRNEKGDFEYTFEIMNVKGIGEAIYFDIKKLITVS